MNKRRRYKAKRRRRLENVGRLTRLLHLYYRQAFDELWSLRPLAPWPVE